jgi:Flp pilus assembly protein TadD
MFGKQWTCLGALVLLVGSLSAQDLNHSIDLFQKKQYDAAAAELQKVVSEDPHNVRARYYLGLCLLQQKRYPEAEKQFTSARDEAGEATEGTPRKDQVLVGLAQAFLGQKEYAETRAAADAAIAVNDQNADAFTCLGRIALEQKNFSAALEHLQKATTFAPKDPYPHYYAGIAYSNLRRPDKMVDEFRTFLKLAPDAPEAAQVRSLLKTVR